MLPQAKAGEQDFTLFLINRLPPALGGKTGQNEKSLLSTAGAISGAK
jgi:hypothetical protein